MDSEEKVDQWTSKGNDAEWKNYESFHFLFHFKMQAPGDFLFTF